MHIQAKDHERRKRKDMKIERMIVSSHNAAQHNAIRHTTILSHIFEWNQQPTMEDSNRNGKRGGVRITVSRERAMKESQNESTYKYKHTLTEY